MQGRCVTWRQSKCHRRCTHRGIPKFCAAGQDGAAAKYILSAIQSLDEEKLSVSRKLSAVHQESRNSVIFLRTLEEKRSEISGFIRNIDNFNEEERNEIARNCIESAVWDGETLTITL